MHIEVDQSGKIEFTGEDTVIGFANHNGISSTIFISSVTKRECVKELRKRGLSGKTFYIQLFSVGLFYLLKDNISQWRRVVIDTEYIGNEDKIKEHLINLLHRSQRRISPSVISFRQIGKKSPAHDVSLNTLRKKIKPTMILTVNDILKQFKAKKIGDPDFSGVSLFTASC